MPSDALIPSNQPGNPQVIVDAIIRMLQDQFPMIISGAAISAALLQQVTKQMVEIVRTNLAILGGVLTTAGLAMLLPSLAVALVNLVGFTATGVISGSLAALIQSSVYAGSTGGLFSMLQSFGATSVIAPPVALALGGTFLVLGAGALGYWLYRRRFGGVDGNSGGHDELGSDDESGDDDDDDDEHPPKENQALIHRPTFNISNLFRRS